MPLAIDPPDTDDENLRRDSSPASARKRATPIAHSVARKPPPDSASANGGAGVAAGGESGFGSSVAHGTMESLLDVPTACDSSGEPDGLHPLMTAGRRAADWSSRACRGRSPTAAVPPR